MKPKLNNLFSRFTVAKVPPQHPSQLRCSVVTLQWFGRVYRHNWAKGEWWHLNQNVNGNDDLPSSWWQNQLRHIQFLPSKALREEKTPNEGWSAKVTTNIWFGIPSTRRALMKNRRQQWVVLVTTLTTLKWCRASRPSHPGDRGFIIYFMYCY
jgi:hypothetical protein